MVADAELVTFLDTRLKRKSKTIKGLAILNEEEDVFVIRTHPDYSEYKNTIRMTLVGDNKKHYSPEGEVFWIKDAWLVCTNFNGQYHACLIKTRLTEHRRIREIANWYINEINAWLKAKERRKQRISKTNHR